MSKEYICPLFQKEMTEEEGLYWCDDCGINNKSITFIRAED